MEQEKKTKTQQAIEWRQKNLQKSNEINKKYYEMNKDKINEKRRQKYKEASIKKKLAEIEYIVNNKDKLIEKLSMHNEINNNFI